MCYVLKEKCAVLKEKCAMFSYHPPKDTSAPQQTKQATARSASPKYVLFMSMCEIQGAHIFDLLNPSDEKSNDFKSLVIARPRHHTIFTNRHCEKKKSADGFLLTWPD